MLKQRLQQKLLQKLSPQQIQMIKLLEIPAMQLEQRIKKELEENPLLEEAPEDEKTPEEVAEDADNEEENATDENSQDEFSLEDYMDEDDIPEYKLSVSNSSPDDKTEEIPFSVGDTFHEYLQSQLGLRPLTAKQQLLAPFILGNIDDDGYLRRKLDAIADDIAFTQNIKTDEFELLEILRIIQDCEPIGVGARDLQECLLLQIERKDPSDPAVSLAQEILKHHFDEFTRKHYDKIIDRLDLEEQDLKEAIDEIIHLNPKPGGAFNDPLNREGQTVVPDFLLEIKDGELQLSLNQRNSPDLRLNRSYSQMIESYNRKNNSGMRQQKELASFVKQKLESARWFIDAIRQRQNTLMMTMESIIHYQHDYFMEGDETKLRPMILKDIAERTGLDISTISRVANSKYIQTHFGIFPLKFFFSEGMQTDSGEEVSTREIKKILQDTIDIEDKRRPVTDDRLAEILKEKGYLIARRTVAKYREQLNIPVARLRKELN
jgi:RNA polymerase sigma-54 factor